MIRNLACKNNVASCLARFVSPFVSVVAAALLSTIAWAGPPAGRGEKQQAESVPDKDWELKSVKLESLESFSSDEFNGAYIIKAGKGQRLIKATMRLTAKVADPNAIQKYKAVNSNLSAADEKALKGQYRTFSLKNLTLQAPSLKPIPAVYVQKPRAEVQFKIGKNGQGSITSGSSNAKGWLHSNAIWIADGATIGKETIPIDSGNNSYVALCEVGAAPQEMEVLFIAPADSDLKKLAPLLSMPRDDR